MSKDTRGSLQVLRQRCKNTQLDENDIARFVRAFDVEGVSIDDVFCLGIPAPEFVGGRIRVDREVLDKVVNRILDLEGLRPRKWEVFVNGIPRIDEAIIDVEVGRGF